MWKVGRRWTCMHACIHVFYTSIQWWRPSGGRGSSLIDQTTRRWNGSTLYPSMSPVRRKFISLARYRLFQLVPRVTITCTIATVFSFPFFLSFCINRLLEKISLINRIEFLMESTEGNSNSEACVTRGEKYSFSLGASLENLTKCIIEFKVWENNFFPSFEFYISPQFFASTPRDQNYVAIIDQRRVSSNQPDDTVSPYHVSGINFSSGILVPRILPFSLLISRLYRT